MTHNEFRGDDMRRSELVELLKNKTLIEALNIVSSTNATRLPSGDAIEFVKDSVEKATRRLFVEELDELCRMPVTIAEPTPNFGVTEEPPKDFQLP